MIVGVRSASASIEDMDEVDRKIIKYLQANGRESFTKIGDELGIPASTVRDRTNRLLDNGILRIVGVLNPLKARQRIMANIGVKLSAGNHQAVADEIAKFDEVAYLVICAGSFDLMVEVICRNQTHLLEFTSMLQGMPGVFQAETFIYYKIVKEIFDLGTV